MFFSERKYTLKIEALTIFVLLSIQIVGGIYFQKQSQIDQIIWCFRSAILYGVPFILIGQNIRKYEKEILDFLSLDRLYLFLGFMGCIAVLEYKLLKVYTDVYMAKNGCRIGGEQSGHIIFSKYASTGDGILTSLKMMEVMLAKKKPMSELAAPLKIYPQVLENVRVTDKKAAQNDEAVQAAVKNVTEALGDTGRILVRESGTEPVVHVMVEAPDHDTCQKYVDEVVNVICEKGYKA